MQLSILEPYPAASASYEVIEVLGPVYERTVHMLPGALADWSSITMTSDFAEATALARQHCVERGVEVWVVDRNDSDFVALRITPEEYSRLRVPQDLPVAA